VLQPSHLLTGPPLHPLQELPIFRRREDKGKTDTDSQKSQRREEQTQVRKKSTSGKGGEERMKGRKTSRWGEKLKKG